MRILIANRGEIARRIIRTADRRGFETVAVFADPDADSPFVGEATYSKRLGPADLSLSYLSIERLLAAAEQSEATAVHPGYGFLSENPDFARACVDAGLIWIGPAPDTIELMGSKIRARQTAVEAGLPIVPGYDLTQEITDFSAAADDIGYPVLIKASAGGGGRGIRVVDDPSGLSAAMDVAAREAEAAFGDGALIMEKYVEAPRHLEVQIIGDHHGNLVHLGTRECSVQRRYQKVLEEAPAPNLPLGLRETLEASAIELGQAVAYSSAGTAEFILDTQTGAHYFLEMNPRLQVEHPVSEAITGLDLVSLQLSVALREPLPITQEEVSFHGHAFEVRINAEDPWSDFAPQVGVLTNLEVPDGVRWDSGVVLGGRISPHYDATIAKLIVSGSTREEARQSLIEALDSLIVGGLSTNTGLLRWIMEQPAVIEGEVTTRFLDEAELPPKPTSADAIQMAARAWIQMRRAASADGAWGRRGPFRVTPHHTAIHVYLRDMNGMEHDVEVATPEHPGLPVAVDPEARAVAVLVAGHTLSFEVQTRSEHWAPEPEVGHAAAGSVVAPFPAVVSEVVVKPGDSVAAGAVLVVIEAMKMLHPLTAAGAGTVSEVRVSVGDQVESRQVLVAFE
jgi:acetyl/propionyl-CoA carboxylase alpha subunit